MSLDDRTEKFKEIIAEIVKQKEEQVEKKKEYSDKLSKLKKNFFKPLNNPFINP